MPPKMVICSMCGKGVLKAQTLAVAGGTRACREHQDVVDESKKLQEAERQDRMKHDSQYLMEQARKRREIEDARDREILASLFKVVEADRETQTQEKVG
jgi:hypothetical protein